MSLTLKEAREHYYFNSGKLSDVNRQLCFAAIGIIWIFSGSTSSLVLPDQLILPLLLISLSLAFDYLHYLSGAVVWGAYSRYREKKSNGEAEKFAPHASINWLQTSLFYSQSCIKCDRIFFIDILCISAS